MSRFGLIKLFVGITLTIIGGNWLSMIPTDTLPFIISSEDNKIFSIAIAMLISISVLAIGLILTYSGRHTLIDLSVSKKRANPKRCMIIFLSYPSPNFKIEKGNNTILKDGSNEIILTGNLDDDINKIGIKWNWQQLLRALQPHKDSLEYIYLIASYSKNGKNSIDSVNDAKMLIQTYFNNIIIDSNEKGIDFNDYESIITHLDIVIDELKKRYNEQDIVIDITGGTKIASIAGASATLNKKVTFQYVDTNEPYDIHEFNVVHWLR
ncbi:MAG: hypothetical protein KatS3mg003_2026 [Candidatus Nitrosocaldaceae archaeon]|nr:MAG: hypothetical protein KatS3mg003_2021 [Candidatus Nitrosocaldaceae archaeon]GIU72547.1 MAG: hypothetical protein KatS3mg003_2026 [Candidatus Nitrosocaldaceae archaeon]